MAELSPDKIAVGAIGAVIGAAIGSLLPGGLTSAITVLLTSAGSITGLIFSGMASQVLGARSPHSYPLARPCVTPRALHPTNHEERRETIPSRSV